MRALGSAPVLRRGVDAVRDAFPTLDRGLAAQAERRDGDPGPHHGVVASRPERLDPRLAPSTVVSASRLQALGTCPLRYLHQAVLRIHLPDDPELDPDAWLGNRERGSLLHGVYETTLREARAQGVKPGDRAFEVLALDALREGIERLRDEVPIPGEGTLARETAALREDVRSFVRMVREQLPAPVELELTFGLGDDDAVTLPVEGGDVRLRGAIDRVDRDLGGIHVVDYKTGSAFGHGSNVFDGGRRLQHAVYAHAAEELLELEVVDGQYHFPTRRGQNQTFVYRREHLAAVGELVGLMLDGVAAGHFVPTDVADDCRFCDYAEVCRVRVGDYGQVDSPLADWSAEHLNTGMQVSHHALKRVRSYEED
jgi:ATP-dependent helicase/nuclease subunit B